MNSTILESNNYSRRWLTADWCCCVAVDLRSRVETYQCGNDIRLSPSAAEVLDEGEGLGHDGVEEPVDVGADIGHRLRTIFILRFAALRGSVLMLGLVASSQEFWCWDWWPAHRNFDALSSGLWCVVPWTLVRCPLDFVVLTAPHCLIHFKEMHN